LHENWQVLPEAREAGQVPSAPFDGAVTVHGLGTHVCAVRDPSRQDVAAPVTA
jgi:hypothetical protein